jgi:hypothetical protein
MRLQQREELINHFPSLRVLSDRDLVILSNAVKSSGSQDQSDLLFVKAIAAELEHRVKGRV